MPHVCITGTCHFGKTRQEVFNRRAYYQDVFCHKDYVERVVSSFTHQIQYEYYGGDLYLPIEGIT